MENKLVLMFKKKKNSTIKISYNYSYIVIYIKIIFGGYMNISEKRNQILAVHKRRFATKKFNPDIKISNEDWETILESGILTPSYFGYEPWKFLLLKNKNMKEELKEIAWGAENCLNNASHFLIVLI